MFRGLVISRFLTRKFLRLRDVLYTMYMSKIPRYLMMGLFATEAETNTVVYTKTTKHADRQTDRQTDTEYNIRSTSTPSQQTELAKNHIFTESDVRW